MKKHVFFIGIGGTGLSAIARLLQEKGHIVSGSDQQISDLARDLMLTGIPVYQGHSAEHLVGVDMVIRSSAIPDSNPEVQAAHAARIPVYKRSDILGELMKDQIGIAIAGTHGKTTTTAMISTMLQKLGLDPSYIIGSVAKNLGNNAHHGSGDYFVIEADEYDRMFLGLSPTIVVITNLEHDHPDCYPTFSDYLQAFKAFTEKVTPHGKVFVYREDAGTQKLLPIITHPTVLTYGTSTDCDYQAREIAPNRMGGYRFTIYQNTAQSSIRLMTVDLIVPGMHNVMNALVTLGVSHSLGLDLQSAANSLTEFSGTSRRFDILGEVNQITIIDDYAHHPTEIQATLQATKSRYPGRKIWAIWQPHTYSRTKILFDEFKNSFTQADHVIVSQIYASREKDDGFSSSQFVDAMQHPDARYIASLEDITAYLVENLSSGDVMLVFSAGDATQVSKDVLSRLTHKEKHHEI
ncbi:MAG: UDP-N-acetylmuramate--L-alanine ligase [Chloroflexi bacterium HGW-Chloroflexi-3]|nr:MAG: UDP-N-acetylmuramate--L-alanine ligase [Chloroflexi bacterium HGW-Chloroflexi-3]